MIQTQWRTACGLRSQQDLQNSQRSVSVACDRAKRATHIKNLIAQDFSVACFVDHVVKQSLFLGTFLDTTRLVESFLYQALDKSVDDLHVASEPGDIHSCRATALTLIGSALRLPVNSNSGQSSALRLRKWQLC